MKKSFLFICLTMLVLSFAENHAQVDTLKSPTMKVILSDSTIYWGRITSSDAERIILSTKSGTEISIPKKQISEIYRAQDLPKEKKIELLIKPRENVQGEPTYIDRNVYKLFVFPTAKPINHGDGFFSLNEIIFPLIGVGFKNIVSVTGGIPLLPFVENPIYYISPKITFFNTNDLSLACGFFWANNNFDTNEPNFSFGYITTTYGSDASNFTTSINYRFAKNPNDRQILIVLGGQHQVSYGGKLIGEFWIPSHTSSFPNNPVFIFGFRTFSKNFSWDVAFGKVFSEKGLFFPWLSICYNFNLYK
ncbi:MAG: hypothetical protein Q8S39_09230 [Ignavibacteria bacterium]|nr:hypothetical protein [Ignavibacteria bacterium]